MSKNRPLRPGDPNSRPSLRPPSGPAGRGRAPEHPDAGQPAHSRISLKELDPGRFELVHPACVARLWDDYQEALDAWRQGEPEEARDMLRFALEGCGDHLWVHCALGQIALELEKDPSLAKGHFGYAYELIERAIPRGFKGLLSPDCHGNQPLYQAIDGLIRCALAAGHAGEVAELKRVQASLSGRSATGRSS